MEDRGAEEVFCVSQNKEQQPTQINAFSNSTLHDEMKSTSNEPEGAGQADCGPDGVREAGVSKWAQIVWPSQGSSICGYR